ncbi:hypothetical protein GB931_02815 [Modestobacter sp. I12A-02628]|uniref:Pycsar effector protein domain-containing protein n=1 Tax=Goekera deserti TaxID=2497753 RepID=A0A7K3WD34_9ACTN|nr:Pycsar system effector family protein [Goekera deserti]MPQ96869.1 hypothetical protein [Goekera deserti]NDI46817.1 hypothetical protein [Goekera deserti]NEL54385.1 hypothetical protein [Goekera deserti]
MTDQDPVDTAWRVHGALADWTGKVDTKASFVLTIESALLVTIIALSSSGRRLFGLDGAALILFWFGVASIVLGVVAVAMVVKPRVRRRDVAQEWHDNYIFFGHLKSWSPAELGEALSEKPVLPVLARQLVNMSKIAWRKHLLVEVSLLCAAVGTVLVALAALIR